MMDKLCTPDFDDVMKKSIRVRECPHCGHVAEIRVVIPMYGRTGARVQCPSCNCQTAYMGITECISELGGKKRLGTPTTPEAMMSGLMEAVRVWNGKGGK